jgi:hypothetical protein
MPWPTQIRTTTCTNSCLCVAIFLISPAGASPLRAAQKGAENAAPTGTRSLRSRRRAGRAAADDPAPHRAATGRVPGRSTDVVSLERPPPSPFSRGRRTGRGDGIGPSPGSRSFLPLFRGKTRGAGRILQQIRGRRPLSQPLGIRPLPGEGGTGWVDGK